MSTEQEAYDEVMGIIRTGWLADPTSAPITMLYDDVKDDQPGEDANGLPLPFGRSSIASIDSENQCIARVGNRQYQESAIATVQIMTPPGDGRLLSNELIDIVRNFFRAAVTTHVEFQQIGPPERIGQDGGYFIVNVPASFVYYQIG